MVGLKDLKQLIKDFKKNECPRLGQKKAVLHKFAEEHGLLKPVKAEVKVEEVKKEEVKKEEPVKKVFKLKKKEEPVKTKKEMNAERLRKVQEIRKSEGLSLKDAWARLKN